METAGRPLGEFGWLIRGSSHVGGGILFCRVTSTLCPERLWTSQHRMDMSFQRNVVQRAGVRRS